MQSMLSEEEIKQAKATAREKISTSKKINDGEKDKAIKAINDPDVIFGMEDVDTVVESFLNK
jgi:3-hydroxyacyl-CoA dehydrogenase